MLHRMRACGQVVGGSCPVGTHTEATGRASSWAYGRVPAAPGGQIHCLDAALVPPFCTEIQVIRLPHEAK